MRNKRAKGGVLSLDEVLADVVETWPCYSCCSVCGQNFVEQITMVNLSRILPPPVCDKCKEGEEE